MTRVIEMLTGVAFCAPKRCGVEWGSGGGGLHSDPRRCGESGWGRPVLVLVLAMVMVGNAEDFNLQPFGNRGPTRCLESCPGM